MAPKAAIAAVLAIVVLAGCGGGSDHPANQGTTGATGKQTATTPRPGEPNAGGGQAKGQPQREAMLPEDRRALVQIGAAIRRLRSLAGPRDRAVLERLLPQIGSLQPRDQRLQRLRTLTMVALGKAISTRDRAALNSEVDQLQKLYRAARARP